MFLTMRRCGLLSSSLSEAGLPLGRYTIEVAASDSGGDHVDDANAGSLAYVLQPNLSITLSPSSFSFGDEVTIAAPKPVLTQTARPRR